MIKKENFNVLNYVKKEEYTGSMDGMRYMLKRDGEEIVVTIWPEPNSYAHTSDDLKTVNRFPLSREGVESICDYLNEQYESQKELWELSKK